ncbi:hypothetical protein [Exiguobacterium sp. SH5S4]|uniref:hypothetical protein n=1 Tax=Exiguobacterium sp. SH5S4 TaxID=2510961 RepID=UPI001375785C|nr:hypothetical protein [Exiguobacterium sp. SH5S4]
MHEMIDKIESILQGMSEISRRESQYDEVKVLAMTHEEREQILNHLREIERSFHKE